MISKRLSIVASFLPQGAILLDVGSDHAYLPIELVESGKIERAIAGEVVVGPYQSAVKNGETHGLVDKIQVRLANGLAAFEETDQAHGFQIVAESILEEAGKYYEIIVVEAGTMNLSASEVRFGPFLSQEASPVFVEKWQKEAGKLEYALDQIPEKNLAERQILIDKIQAIKEVLHASK